MTLWHRIAGFLLSTPVILTVVWSGMFALTVALVIVMRTRWGQQKPLRKCVVLSLFAHVLLLALFTTIHFTHRRPGRGAGKAMRVTLVDAEDDRDARGAAAGLDGGRVEPPWETPAESLVLDPHEAELTPNDLPPPDNAHAALDPDAPPLIFDGTDSAQPDVSKPAEAREIAAADAPPTAEVQAPNDPGPAPRTAAEADVAAQSTPTAPDDSPNPTEHAQREPPPIDVVVSAPAERPAEPPLVALRPRPESTNAASAAPTPAATGEQSAADRTAGPYTIPELYRHRVAPNRLQIAEGYGGSATTEAAVNAALAWLARHQAADGRWDASDHGAGQETRTLGQDRRGAGAQADTGITGLALLAFLGAGHTHRSEEYGQVIGRGLDYLLAIQAADGNLAGHAEIYAFMYSHGMATLALSEDFAMTGDARLTRPVHRAIGYTIMAQNLAGGGWRYKPPYPADRGDTSQLGWQLMSLKSAELSGIPIPERTRQGIVRYINSVASGRQGGLASYRPEERATQPMTAEALACREFLGLSRAGAAGEAGDYILTAPPGQGPANFYYWYYGTLAMFQLQDDRWTKWNDALTAALTRSQRSDADAQGSWDPDPVWGGYGGRVFSTSLGALCLEVYYRYLPVYTVTAGREKSAK